MTSVNGGNNQSVKNYVLNKMTFESQIDLITSLKNTQSTLVEVNQTITVRIAAKNIVNSTFNFTNEQSGKVDIYSAAVSKLTNEQINDLQAAFSNSFSTALKQTNNDIGGLLNGLLGGGNQTAETQLENIMATVVKTKITQDTINNTFTTIKPNQYNTLDILPDTLNIIGSTFNVTNTFQIEVVVKTLASNTLDALMETRQAMDVTNDILTKLEQASGSGASLMGSSSGIGAAIGVVVAGVIGLILLVVAIKVFATFRSKNASPPAAPLGPPGPFGPLAYAPQQVVQAQYASYAPQIANAPEPFLTVLDSPTTSLQRLPY